MFPNKCKYIKVDIDDTPSYKISPYFKDVFNFIESAFTEDENLSDLETDLRDLKEDIKEIRDTNGHLTYFGSNNSISTCSCSNNLCTNNGGNFGLLTGIFNYYRRMSWLLGT